MSKNKQQLTKTLIELLPDDHKLSLNEALVHWYCNVRSSGGLRLTLNGYHAFKILGLESWAIPLTDLKATISKPILLELDRKMQYPYYIDFKNKKLILYSSREAMMVSLHSSLANFLKNHS